MSHAAILMICLTVGGVAWLAYSAFMNWCYYRYSAGVADGEWPDSEAPF